MKKPILISALLFFVTVCVQAQEGVVAKKADKGLYIEHKVGAGEGLYAIGRIYQVHPRSIAAANKMDMNKGLDLGEVIRIPLTDTNFIQKGNTGTPVYYIVGNNEGLLSVSNAANKVTMQSLRDWNQLTSDQLQAGQRLIIGFVKASNLPVTTVNTVQQKKEVVEVVMEAEKEEVKPVVKEEKEEVAKADVLPVKKEEEPEQKKEAIIPAATASHEQGFFKPYYEQQIKSKPATKESTVTAGIFKTTSGWQDGKYYLLIDGVAPGSIIKVSNPATSKIIYAKVLGEMNGISLNQGLGIRISNAAAAALGVTDTEKFVLQINY
ncbi:MAG TPA: LysM peptidoglycan-binding domain-containing protein [Chitinophagaceae bacterium]|nr:LysM peptidoglycan-binding domain-containing protein [Chitinophagaceae bacterium]